MYLQMRATKGDEQMNGYEIIILALSCLFAGYNYGVLATKGDKNEQSNGTDDELGND